MTRSAIFTTMICASVSFLNGTDAKESFSVFHCTAVLHQLALNDVGLRPPRSRSWLHGFDDAEDLAGRDMLAYAHEGRRIERGGFVERADDGAFRVDVSVRFRISRAAFRSSGPPVRPQAPDAATVAGPGTRILVDPYFVAPRAIRTYGGYALVIAALHFEFGDAHVSLTIWINS